jgi:hypothetical protein
MGQSTENIHVIAGLVPAIHVLAAAEAWITGTNPMKTNTEQR